MNYTEEEERIFLEEVGSRFNAEKEIFFNELNGGNKSFSELLEFVEECDSRLQDDMKEVDVNDNTRAFFNRLMMEINSYYSNIYFNDPKLLTQKITNKCNAISSSFSTCEGKISKGLNVSGDLSLFKNRIDKLDIFVKNFDNEAMRNNPVVARVLDKTKSFLKEASKDYEILRKKAGVLAKKEAPKVSDEIQKDVLFIRINRYLDNLMKSRTAILGAQPKGNSEDFDSIVARLKEQRDLFIKTGMEHRSSIYVAVESIEKDLKKQFNYSVDKNVIKKNLVGRASDAIKETADSVKNSSGVQKVTKVFEDNNRYISLLKVMYDFSEDLHNKASLFIDQNSYGDGSKLGEYDYLDSQLKNLIESVEARTISCDDASAYFKNIVRDFNNRFGYVYKEEKAKYPKKRQIVGYKKLGLGIGGVALGAIGVGSLISNVILYAQFGYIYAGITPLVIPAAVTIVAGIMLKKAFTLKEKRTVLRFIQKLKGKSFKNRGIEPDMEGKYYDEGQFEDLGYTSSPSPTFDSSDSWPIDGIEGYSFDGYVNDDSYTNGRGR